ncbi:MAG: tetratricopeptide repeat protein, partial [candidate division Zixibacteria bacterium]|nr:tetratricopeptide repeat protein [candidate division Zixibacteria bacterium]
GSGNIKNDIDPVDAEKEKEDDKISTQSTIEHFSELVSSDTKTKISQGKDEIQSQNNGVGNKSYTGNNSTKSKQPDVGFNDLQKQAHLGLMNKNSYTKDNAIYEEELKNDLLVDSKTEDESGTIERQVSPEELKEYFDDSTELKQRAGIAYLYGNSVKFVSGITLNPGDIVKYQDKEFKLKAAEEEKKKTSFIWPVITIFSLLLLLFSIFTGAGIQQTGNITIMAFDGRDGTAIPVATATIKEMDEKVSTGPGGFISFKSLTPGLYTITLSSPGYESLTLDGIAVTKAGISTLSPKLYTPEFVALNSKKLPEVKTNTQKPAAKKTEPSSKKTVKGKKTGTLKINIKPRNASITLDGKVLGGNNNEYSNIKPGKHILRGSAKGYKNFWRTIRISGGKTYNFKHSMKVDKSAKQPSSKKDSKSQTSSGDVKKAGNSELALQYEKQGKYRDAINQYKKALEENPSSYRTIASIARNYSNSGNKDDAQNFYLDAARKAYDLGKYKDAAELYSEVLKLNNNNLSCYLGRSYTYQKLGKYELAIKDLSQVLEIDSRYIAAYFQLGYCYYKTEQYKEAADYFKESLKYKNNDAKILSYLTRCYAARNDKSKTKKYYKEFKIYSSPSLELSLNSDPNWQKAIEIAN